MHDITCLDNYGNVIHYFTQWDVNQNIYIEDSDFTTAPQFHFENKKSSLSVVKQSSIDSNGVISVSVPNEFTIVAQPIDIYIYSSTSNTSQTVYHMTIPVYARKQPNDLISEDDIEFLAISELEKRVKNLKDIINGLSFDAGNITYDNTVSGLESTNIQDAMDEIVENYVFIDKDFEDSEGNDGSGDSSGDNNGNEGNTNDSEDNGSGDSTISDTEKVSNAKKVIEEAINNMIADNATNTFDIQSVVDTALINAGITNITTTVKDVVNTNATTETTGTVTGIVDIVCGATSDTVDIDKIIAMMLEEDVVNGSNAKKLVEYYYNNNLYVLDISTTEEHCLATTIYGMDLAYRCNTLFYDPVHDDVLISIRDLTYKEEENRIAYDVVITCGTYADIVPVSVYAYDYIGSWNTSLGRNDTITDKTLYQINNHFNTHWLLYNDATALDVEKACLEASDNMGVIISISDYVVTSCTGVDSLGSISCKVTATFNNETKTMEFSEVIRHIPNNGEIVYLYDQGTVSPWCGGFVNEVYPSENYITNTIGSSYLAINCSDYNGSSSYIESSWRFANRLYVNDFSKLCVQYDFECDDIANCGEIECSVYETTYSISSKTIYTDVISEEVINAIITYDSIGVSAYGFSTKSYQGFSLKVNTQAKACTLKIKKIWLEP